jgi:Rhodopirellula transposase DDE domain
LSFGPGSSFDQAALFGSRETSDAWVDALRMWWLQVRAVHGHVKRLVISLDNGPKNSGRRTQFLKRMIQFADWSRLEIRLMYRQRRR